MKKGLAWLVGIYAAMATSQGDTLERLGMKNGESFAQSWSQCDVDGHMPAGVADAMSAFTRLRTRIHTDRAQLEDCIHGRDLQCAWTTSAIAQLCPHSSTLPRVEYELNSTIHNFIRALAAGLESPDPPTSPGAPARRRLFGGTNGRDPFSQLRTFTPRSSAEMHKDENDIIDKLIQDAVLDESQRGTARIDLRHMDEEILRQGIKELSKMPSPQRMKMVTGKMTTPEALDYATTRLPAWCASMDADGRDAWRNAVHRGQAQSVAQRMCSDDVCVRVLTSEEGALAVRSMAVFLVLECKW